MTLDMVDDVLSGLSEPAIDQHYSLLVSGAVEVSPPNGDCIAALRFLAYSDDVYFISHTSHSSQSTPLALAPMA